MQKESTTIPQAKPMLMHNLILEERKKLTISGVLKVISCDEYGAILETSAGRLSIIGNALNVSTLSIETGELQVHGTITELAYSENKESGSGFLSRFLR